MTDDEIKKLKHKRCYENHKEERRRKAREYYHGTDANGVPIAKIISAKRKLKLEFNKLLIKKPDLFAVLKDANCL